VPVPAVLTQGRLVDDVMHRAQQLEARRSEPQRGAALVDAVFGPLDQLAVDEALDALRDGRGRASDAERSTPGAPEDVLRAISAGNCSARCGELVEGERRAADLPGVEASDGSV